MEFKGSWENIYTGAQVIRSICAFANDFQNLNGGYIVIGVAEENGAAVMPAKGLTAAEVEEAQQWIRGRCNTIDPVYQPILSPEVINERRILVVWAPGSQVRPHQAPESAEKGGARRYYIRLGSSTVDADTKLELKTQLIQLTARVPFDDRRALQASVLDIRETKVREFLHDIGSGLVDEPDSRTMYRHLRVSEPVNDHDVPKNVGLLFFSQNPEQWFPGARIEVVQFGADASGPFMNNYENVSPIWRTCPCGKSRNFPTGLKPCIGWGIPSWPCGRHWSMRSTIVPTKETRSQSRFTFTRTEWRSSVTPGRFPD